MTLPVIFGGVEVILVILLVLLSIILPVIALVDIVKSRFDDNTKLIWVIIVVFANIIGAILYFAIGKNQKIRIKGSSYCNLTYGRTTRHSCD